MGKLLGGAIGTAGSYELDWANNALQVVAAVNLGPAVVSLNVAVGADALILALEGAIKNQTVDGLLEGLRKIVDGAAPVAPVPAA